MADRSAAAVKAWASRKAGGGGAAKKAAPKAAKKATPKAAKKATPKSDPETDKVSATFDKMFGETAEESAAKIGKKKRSAPTGSKGKKSSYELKLAKKAAKSLM